MKLINLNGTTGLVLGVVFAGSALSVAGHLTDPNETTIPERAADTALERATDPTVLPAPDVGPRVHQQLQDIVATFYEIGSWMNSDSIQRGSADAIPQIHQMTPEQVQAASYASAEIARLHEAVMHLRRLMLIEVTTQPAPADGEETPGFPVANYSLLCGSARTNTEIFFAARVVFQVAQGVWSVASRGCEQVAVVCPAPGGGNTSTLCIPVDVVFFLAQIVFDEIANCDEDIDSAEIEGSYERLGHIHGDIELVDAKIEALISAIEELRLVNCEIIRLLHTPQGQRESDLGVCFDQTGFPYSWPQR